MDNRNLEVKVIKQCDKCGKVASVKPVKYCEKPDDPFVISYFCLDCYDQFVKEKPEEVR